MFYFCPKLTVQFGSRILLVEDSRVNQVFAAELLKTLNCSVEIAENGVVALEKYRTGAYDLILMDCMMPEMDGYEATAAIREEEETKAKGHIPIVALTANALDGDREKCLDAGMDDYIAKPAKRAQVEQMLSRHLHLQAA